MSYCHNCINLLNFKTKTLVPIISCSVIEGYYTHTTYSVLCPVLENGFRKTLVFHILFVICEFCYNLQKMI